MTIYQYYFVTIKLAKVTIFFIWVNPIDNVLYLYGICIADLCGYLGLLYRPVAKVGAKVGVKVAPFIFGFTSSADGIRFRDP